MNGNYDPETGEYVVISKCALGEISCQSGNTIEITKSIPTYDYRKILELVKGLPGWMLTNGNLPPIGYEDIQSERIELGGANLQSIIYTMNDNGYTYPEIVEFLETTFGDIENEA